MIKRNYYCTWHITYIISHKWLIRSFHDTLSSTSQQLLFHPIHCTVRIQGSLHKPSRYSGRRRITLWGQSDHCMAQTRWGVALSVDSHLLTAVRHCTTTGGAAQDRSVLCTWRTASNTAPSFPTFLPPTTTTNPTNNPTNTNNTIITTTTAITTGYCRQTFEKKILLGTQNALIEYFAQKHVLKIT